MRPLSAAELLDVWEQGQALPPAQRALALLAPACPETGPEVLAGLSVGRRDALLMTLREWTFGPQLELQAACPGCAARQEAGIRLEELRLAEVECPETLSLAEGEYRVRFRLPDSLDLVAIAGCGSAEAGRELLLERCVLSAERNGEPVAVGGLPADVCAAVSRAMADADPQADMRLALSCPSCGHPWEAIFDIAGFFWSELQAWAWRTLRQVHTLASAYGWSEAEILALSPWRRQCYLDMVGA